jgi:hypothetical protein
MAAVARITVAPIDEQPLMAEQQSGLAKPCGN